MSAHHIPRPPWKGRRIVLGVTGGIAAYKSIQLARDLTRLGAEVDVVLTGSAGRFVTPLSFQALTGRPVHTDLFDLEGGSPHIRLGTEAHAVCVAPATADLVARAAHGRADDLLTTLLLVARSPILLCPAMNHRMFEHPQTRANLAHCREVLGYEVVGPAAGPLAYGEEEGPGRMIEPGEIVEHLGRALGRDPVFSGRRVLVTAGPTREPLDPVRYLSNRSSGRMGFALARAAWRRGADVALVTGPTDLEDPPAMEVVRVETAREMHQAVTDRAPDVDVFLFAAAVGDYRPAEPSERKLKRSREGRELSIPLTANPDVAAGTREGRKAGAVAVGFALETEDLVENARRKLQEKGLDLVVANPAAEEGAGFDAETNRVTLLGPDEEPTELPVLPKDEVAEAILDRVAGLLGPETA